MTRKDFEVVAKALKAAKPDREDGFYVAVQWRRTVAEMAAALALTNGRFNRDRFLRACGMEV